MPCYSPLKGWKDDETGGIKFRQDGSREKMEVACGQCLGCRADRRRMWSMRIVHESCVHETRGGNSFITLTYRDKSECDDKQLEKGLHVPDDWSLHKEHLQRFMKRLRKFFAPEKIRFYACGEYGAICKHGIDTDLVKCPLCNVGRPHYHACLFNCTFPDREPYGSRNGDLRYTSPTLEKIWKYGFVDVGSVTAESAAYVAGYCLKKVTGVAADDWYMSFDTDGVITFLTPEFTLMSRGHTCKLHRGMPYQLDCPDCSRGLGRDWYEMHPDDFHPGDTVPVVGQGVVRGMPRYYDELYADISPEGIERVKELRKEFRRKHSYDFTPDRLMSRYKVHKDRVGLFRRNL